jgi:NADH-quinone oxidoreductase subunit N
MEAFPSAIATWQPIVAGLAIASMVLGNLVALAQRPLKRMLAYSSVAHAGYLLVAVWPGTAVGAGSVMLYLLAYSLTSLATFGLLAALGRGGERDVGLDDIAGLASARPWMAFALTVCMLSLLGFPGTFGFIGKWYIISAVVAEGHYLLPVILVLTSVVSAGYYLPVIMAMYMKPAPAGDRYAGLRLAPAAFGAITLTVAAVLFFGFWPGAVLDLAGQTGTTLTQTGVPIAGP